MSPSAHRSGLTDRDHVALGAAVVALLAGILIWTLWVLPIVSSVEEAPSSPLGRTVLVDLEEGARSGVWASGISPALGSTRCTVIAPDGVELPLRGAPSLTWDDTLWWMTPRRGFEQVVQFTASVSGVHDVTCVDSLGTYDGEFLVAGDTFGGGELGLGRTGSNGFAIGTVLAFCAVVLPLFSVLLPLVIGLRVAFTRRASGRRTALS